MYKRSIVRIFVLMVSALPWACGGDPTAARAPAPPAPPPPAETSAETAAETATANETVAPAEAMDTAAFSAAIVEANAAAAAASDPADAGTSAAEMEQAMAEGMAEMDQAMAEGMAEMERAMAEGMEEMGEALAQGMAESMAMLGEVMATMAELSPRLQALEERYDLDTEEGIRAAADELDAIGADIRTRAEAAENPHVREMLANMADDFVTTATLAREDPAAALQRRRDKMESEAPPAMP